jgi:glycosyltransferase involved in cell wall biosynthesis
VPRLVSAIIPTYNRSRDLRIAVGTALAQTYPASALEIIVVDDGSTDDTAEVVRREFGDRVRYLNKPNGGVSSARNHGMAAAKGDYLALLDSDDEWLPTHVEAQAGFLDRRPDFGLVITDVARMDEQRRDFEIFRRREFIPVDGWVLPYVLRNPALAPASAMLTRAVYEDVGGFDETLRTAEDLDFHLRIALRWQIGVIEEPLTRAMRGHEGLSALARTYRDYLEVVERFVARHGDAIAARDRDAALLHAYARNARGMLYDGDLPGALRCAARSAVRARSGGDARLVGRLGIDLAKGLAVRARRAVRGEATPAKRS